MTLLYVMLGLIASLDLGLKSHSIHGFRLDWLVFLGLPFAVLPFCLFQMSRDGNIFIWGSSATLAGLIVVLLLMVKLRHHVVFRPDDEAWAHGDVESKGPPTSMLASARFTYWDEHWTRGQRLLNSLLFGGSRSQWFVETPTRLLVLESGAYAFETTCDPSISFSILRSVGKAASWRFVVDSEQSPEIVRGSLFLGRHCRPAVRLQFFDQKGRRRSAFVSFEDISGRQWFEQIRWPEITANRVCS